MQRSAKSSPLAWLQALRQPDLVLNWTLLDWERVVRLSRRARLLGRLAEAVDGSGLLNRVPAPARRHLIAEQHLSRMRSTALCWSIDRVQAALGDATYPRVLLKGAAYVAQQLPIAKGRLPSDLDMMVPKQSIDDAQARFLSAGWVEADLDAHDRQYYREWSHEVPPMTHPSLQMELDLHHNILPPVAHVPIDANLLLAKLMPSRLDGWYVLDPVDQVLHSAAHLFFDSDLQDRVRDLVDLDGLLRHFGQEPGFWARLTSRSEELGLGEPLSLACHFTMRWLGTPLPPASAAAIVSAGPSPLQRVWLLPLLNQVLMPTEPDELPGVVQKFAAVVILARYHWRRMPLRLLVPHLWYKLHARQAPLVSEAADMPATR